MSEEDKGLLQSAITSCVVGVAYAFDKKWEGRHLLAQVSKPTTAFDPTDVAEKQWWIEQLKGCADRLAVLPIVERESECLRRSVRKAVLPTLLYLACYRLPETMRQPLTECGP
jgi:hypothetical protein